MSVATLHFPLSPKDNRSEREMKNISYFPAWETVSSLKTANSLCDANMALFPPHRLGAQLSQCDAAVIEWPIWTLIHVERGAVKDTSQIWEVHGNSFINYLVQKEHAVPRGHALTHRHTHKLSSHFSEIYEIVLLWKIASKMMGMRSLYKPQIRSICMQCYPVIQ